MRNEFIVASAFAVLFFCSNVLLAKPANEPRPATPRKGAVADFIPLTVSTYRTPDAMKLDVPTVRVETANSGLLRYDGVPQSSPLLQGDAVESRKRNKYIPVLLSLLVPGAGEIYMGYYKLGVPLVAVEAVAWTGYAVYHNKGLDSRAEYERFADEHWSYDKWIYDHPTVRDLRDENRTFEMVDSIGRTSWSGWPGYHTWHSREEEKQNYYENIGKYDWFISGWEDWEWDDVANPDDPPRSTALRDVYRNMRKKSNDELDRAQKFIYLSLAARVVSLVETVLLVRKDQSDNNEVKDEKKLSISARPTGLDSGRIVLKYRF
ncbi:MAG: hypothetical protein JSW58_10460 [Candidatus Latescibacterota bacterium]|nr:MAG: hypothetical protein JSW58_10460 [Candidatus Latescibacterota bacterium]